MSYTISCINDGTTQQVLGGRTVGSIYTLVTQSESTFNITPAGATGPNRMFPLGIVDNSVSPQLWASPGPGVVESVKQVYGWNFSVLRNNQWAPVQRLGDLPVDVNVPTSIGFVSFDGSIRLFWRAENNRILLVQLENNPPTGDQAYQFYISTYNNVVRGKYNVLASSDGNNIPKQNIITKMNDNSIDRETILLDFTNFPDVVVTTNKLCSPTSVQYYKGYKISSTEFFLAENQTTIDIAKESGNLIPNFIVKKSFNREQAHIVQFKDKYLFISKETGISSTTLENINKINNNNGYPTMYPLRNAINCFNVNTKICPN